MNINNMNKLVAGLLFIGALNMPYGYYRLLRIIVTISSGIFCFKFHEQNNMNMVYLFGFIAILFNPLIPIYFDKDTWVIIDIVAGGIFFFNNPDDASKN